MRIFATHRKALPFWRPQKQSFWGPKSDAFEGTEMLCISRGQKFAKEGG